MTKQFVLVLAFIMGMFAGGIVMAQTATPPAHEHEHAGSTATPMSSTMPMASGLPIPMASGMPMHEQMMSPSECAAMQRMMQEHMKSQADRAMMQSMMTMHRSMMRSNFTGNVDHDFLVMMIPHHQAAVDAARVELKNGKDAKVRALAQRIIKAQEAEIKEMRAWLAEQH